MGYINLLLYFLAIAIVLIVGDLLIKGITKLITMIVNKIIKIFKKKGK